MKSRTFGLVLGLGMLASGCGVFDVYRDRQWPAPTPSATQDLHVAPQVPSETPALPPVTAPDVAQLPPYWFWADQQQQAFDRYLQQQWLHYYQNRQPPPQFPPTPTCQSILLGGQVITICR
jgi:hypothetical protein